MKGLIVKSPQSKSILNFFATKKWYLMALAILVPAVLQQMLASSLNLIDNLMVGQLHNKFITDLSVLNNKITNVFQTLKIDVSYQKTYTAGDFALAGVTASNQIFIIIFAFMGGFINAISVFGAQFFGAGRYGSLRQTASLRIIIGFFIGIIVIVLSYTLGREIIEFTTDPFSNYDKFSHLCTKISLNSGQKTSLIAHLTANTNKFNSLELQNFLTSINIKADNEYLIKAILEYYEYEAAKIITNEGIAYNKIIVLSYPILGINFAFISLFQETKRGYIPLILSIFALVINLLLNKLLINGIPELGVQGIGTRGAALATLIARILQLGIILLILFWKKYEFKPQIKSFFQIKMALIKNLFVKSWPIIINDLLFALAGTFSLRLFRQWSLELFPAVAVAGTINGIFYTLYVGFGIASSVLIANQLGSSNLKAARYNGNHLIKLGFFASLFFSTLLVVASFFLPQLLFPGTTKAAIRISSWMLRVDALVFSAYTIMYVCIYAFRAGGQTVTVLVVDSILTWSITILVLTLQIYFASYDIIIIYLFTRLTEVIKMIVCLYIYNKGKWVQNLTSRTTIYDESVPEIKFVDSNAVNNKIDIANF